MRASFRPSDVPTAVGLMLTIVAIGGVMLPPIYAELVVHVGARGGWAGLAGITLLCSIVALLDVPLARQMRVTVL